MGRVAGALGPGTESARDPIGGCAAAVLRLRLRSFAAPMDARMESVLNTSSARDAMLRGVARKSKLGDGWWALRAPARGPVAVAAVPRLGTDCCSAGASSKRSERAMMDSSASSKRSGSEVPVVARGAPGQVQLVGHALEGPVEEPVHPSERV